MKVLAENDMRMIGLEKGMASAKKRWGDKSMDQPFSCWLENCWNMNVVPAFERVDKNNHSHFLIQSESQSSVIQKVCIHF